RGDHLEQLGTGLFLLAQERCETMRAQQLDAEVHVVQFAQRFLQRQQLRQEAAGGRERLLRQLEQITQLFHGDAHSVEDGGLRPGAGAARWACRAPPRRPGVRSPASRRRAAAPPGGADPPRATTRAPTSRGWPSPSTRRAHYSYPVLISVLLPARNAAATLREALESIFGQRGAP